MGTTAFLTNVEELESTESPVVKTVKFNRETRRKLGLRNPRKQKRIRLRPRKGTAQK